MRCIDCKGSNIHQLYNSNLNDCFCFEAHWPTHRKFCRRKKTSTNNPWNSTMENVWIGQNTLFIILQLMVRSQKLNWRLTAFCFFIRQLFAFSGQPFPNKYTLPFHNLVKNEWTYPRALTSYNWLKCTELYAVSWLFVGYACFTICVQTVYVFSNHHRPS